MLSLCQFIINHERKEYFYLGITSIALALRISTNSPNLLSIIITSLSAELKFKIEYLAMWIVPACVTQMLLCIYPVQNKGFGKILKNILIISDLVLGLISFCVPAYYTNRLVPALQIGMGLICAYVIVLTFINLIKRRRYAIFNFLSYLSVIIGAGIDVLISHGAKNVSISLMPFFLVIFVLILIMMFSMSACGTKSVEPVVTEGLPEFTVHGKTDLPGNFFLSFV